MKKKKLLPYIILGLIIGYQAWLYRAELKIQSELNDNTFQFAMVKQTEDIFKQVLKGKLSFWYLIDHWNPIWGQGAPLAFYYNHLPQVLTVLSHRISHLFFPSLSLFRYFEILKYILFILTPLTFFYGSQLLGFGLWASLGAALVAGFIRTYGFFGIDASSYIFAGYGLTSQLMAVFLMPLAFGKGYQTLNQPTRQNLFWACFLNFWVIQNHVGMGTILLISEMVLVLQFQAKELNLKQTLKRAKSLILVFLLTLLASGYFLIPMVVSDAFRNFSIWEGLWKFNSFGWQKVITDLLNGQLFDYSRLPIITALSLLGLFIALTKTRFAYLGIGFTLWMLAFFGRTTWGPLFNFLPGLKDFYLHRFIIGIHFFGIMLSGLAIEFLILKLSKYIKIANVGLLILGLLFIALNPVVKNYAQNNQRLITEANRDFLNDEADFQKIMAVLESINPLKHRIFAGTPGGWGRNFMVGQTPVYQRLSVLGYPVMNFYAHSWSLSSQTESFFEETKEEDCRLYNVGFFILPDWYQPSAFMKPTAHQGKYHLYQFEKSGYFSLVYPGPTFAANKNNFINLVHLWQKSDWLKNSLFPRLSFATDSWSYRMVDLNHYLDPNSKEPKNLYTDSPFAYQTNDASKKPPAPIFQEELNLDGQKFLLSAYIECPDCLVVFSQSYHPNWQIKIDGQKVAQEMVFPGFLAFKPKTGEQKIEISYACPLYKKLLLIIGWPLLFATIILQDRRLKN
jgi:hypothetical protein